MRILCCGGTGEEGRSCILLSPRGGRPLMVDCGVQREFSPGRPGRYPLVPSDLPERFPLLLTHAHEDHVAALPRLIAQGYKPAVHATRQTAALTPDCCRTWLKAVDKAVKADGGDYPYGEEHIQAIDWHILPDGEAVIGPWRVRHGPAAHLPGSCWYLLVHDGRRVCVSGDWNPRSLVYPSPDFPLCDLFITDASGRDGDEKGQEALAALAPLALEKPVLLPLPRLGRCQEMFSLLASIPALTQKKGAVAMDAPLVDALDVWLADEAVDGKGRAALELARALFASGAWIRFTQPAEAPPGPRLIGAMDAMLSTGSSGELCARVLREGGTVIFSGHAAQGTPGRTLLDSGNPDVIRLPWKIHPNEDDILAALGKTEAQRVLLVHTPHKKAIQIARRLHEKTGVVATAPATGDTLRVNDRPGDSA